MNPDGSVASRAGRQKNLLLDSGLDKIATNAFATCISSAAVGTGTTPTLRDSGAITVSQSGTTATASAGYFLSTDVGALLVYDSGQQVYITGFTSSTVVTVGTSMTVSSSLACVWFVNQTGLTTETKRTSSYTNNAGDNQNTFSVDTWTLKQTYLFSAEVGSVTYQEIGWSPSSSSGNNLFGRALFTTPPSLGVGQQLAVTVFLTIKLSPSTPTSVGNVGTGTYNTAGTHMIEACIALTSAAGISGIQSSGGPGVSGAACLEPSLSANLATIGTAFTQNTGISSTTAPSSSGVTQQSSFARGSYTAGTFNILLTFTFSPTTANGTHAGIALNFGSGRTWSLLFTSAQTKDSSHTLVFNVRLSWQRILVNP